MGQERRSICFDNRLEEVCIGKRNSGDHTKRHTTNVLNESFTVLIKSQDLKFLGNLKSNFELRTLGIYNLEYKSNLIIYMSNIFTFPTIL